MRKLLLAALLALSVEAKALELRASPSVINYGGVLGLTWNGAPGKPGDWVGLFTYQSPDANPWVWIKAEATSYTWVLPAYLPVSACYDFRLFSQWSFNKLGSSNCVWVQDPNQPVAVEPAPAPDPAPAPAPAPLHDYTGALWTPGPNINGVQYSPNASPSVGGVTFPTNGEIDYVTTPAAGALPYGGKVRFRFRLHGGPLIGSTGSHSSGLFLHFQQAGDNWTGQGAYNCYRQWSNEPVFLSGVTGPQEFEIEVPLTENHWGGVLSGCAQGQFQAALAGVAQIGWTHLDDQSKGHGNKTSVPGTRIEVLEYKVLQ
jgi:hypothetical protein